MVNKRGQGLSTNAIVLIILAVIVLVILILGFTMGWDKILPFIKTNNVENIKTACALACTTENTYDFCSAPRILKADDLPTGGKKVTESCFFFSTNENYEVYDIAECTAITCSEE